MLACTYIYIYIYIVRVCKEKESNFYLYWCTITSLHWMITISFHVSIMIISFAWFRWRSRVLFHVLKHVRQILRNSSKPLKMGHQARWWYYKFLTLKIFQTWPCVLRWTWGALMHDDQLIAKLCRITMLALACFYVKIYIYMEKRWMFWKENAWTPLSGLPHPTIINLLCSFVFSKHGYSFLEILNAWTPLSGFGNNLH